MTLLTYSSRLRVAWGRALWTRQPDRMSLFKAKIWKSDHNNFGAFLTIGFFVRLDTTYTTCLPQTSSSNMS
jgi:hypothetical protein